MGLHRSPHRGFSAEFAELRAYQAGDDLRYIDWRMFGRSDRYYVKQFEEETSLRACCSTSAAPWVGRRRPACPRSCGTRNISRRPSP